MAVIHLPYQNCEAHESSAGSDPAFLRKGRGKRGKSGKKGERATHAPSQGSRVGGREGCSAASRPGSHLNCAGRQRVFLITGAVEWSAGLNQISVLQKEKEKEKRKNINLCGSQVRNNNKKFLVDIVSTGKRLSLRIHPGSDTVGI